MQWREFMKAAGLGLAAQAIPQLRAGNAAEKPHIILIVVDQRTSLSKYAGAGGSPDRPNRGVCAVVRYSPREKTTLMVV